MIAPDPHDSGPSPLLLSPPLSTNHRLQNDGPLRARRSHRFLGTLYYLRCGLETGLEARPTTIGHTTTRAFPAMPASEPDDAASSPIHRAVWERGSPSELFQSAAMETPGRVQTVMDRSFELIRQHRQQGTLWNAKQQLDEGVARELGAVGYWGLLAEPHLGGSGASFRSFAPFLTRIATQASSLAGLASVHSCLGPLHAIRTFGTPLQKAQFVPGLARGERLTAFAMTEPPAGSDLSAIRTRAERQGNDWVINGEKLFISNAALGRTIGLVCLIEQKPAMLICELPASENDQFQMYHYGLHALRHTANCGMRFRDFRVPYENRLVPPHGNGLTIAYHGLNRGRVAVCAIAAGTLRLMLANLLPWVHFRRTYGQPLAARELVQARLARLAALIIGCDALTAWCSGLLDQGYRGELECIVAKVFSTEAQKEAAIELLMKTQGGRAFLHGQLFGDYLYDFLAPCIYEGESSLLALAFLRRLVKNHLAERVEPLIEKLAQDGFTRFQPWRPDQLFQTGKPAIDHLRWRLEHQLSTFRPVALLDRFRQFMKALSLVRHQQHDPASAFRLFQPTSDRADRLQRYAKFGQQYLQRMALQLDRVCCAAAQQADQQLQFVELSHQIQRIVVVVCTASYAGQQKEPIVQAAAELLCSQLLSQALPKNQSLRQTSYTLASELGAAIAQQGFPGIEACEPSPIPFSYPQ